MRIETYIASVKKIEIGPVKQTQGSSAIREIVFVTEDGTFHFVASTYGGKAADLALHMMARSPVEEPIYEGEKS